MAGEASGAIQFHGPNAAEGSFLSAPVCFLDFQLLGVWPALSHHLHC